MKILYINHDNNINGSTIALRNIIQELCKKHEIRVVTPITYNMSNSELIQFFKNNKIKYYSFYYGLTIYPLYRKNIINWLIDFYRMLKNTIKARKEIRKIINEFEPDIVHTNNGPIDIAFNYCKKKNIPHIWHLREYSDIGLGLKIFPSIRYWRKKILSTGNYNIAITKGVYKYYNLRECDTVIYDGPINLKNGPTIHTEKDKYFLFVGSPSQDGKGFYDALVAFNEIHNDFPTYKLIGIGPFNINSSYGKKIIEYINTHNLHKKIELLGYRNDVCKWMEKATALLVTSYFEGFGLTTAEAMFCNCLVIGRNTTGTKEQLDNGLIKTGEEIGYRFNTISELSICMRKAINEDTTDIQIRAQNVVKELYSSTRSNELLERYYYKIKGTVIN